MIEEIREFPAEIVRGEKTSRVIAGAVLCDSSVSITVGTFTIHVPWSEVAAWITTLAKQTQEKA